jgi:hypothetical protein
MRGSSKQLIMFAWGIEIVGVTGGALNSAYTTFGDQLPSSLYGYFPVVPMIAVAMAEVGRVPLASVLYHKNRLIKVLAIVGILALSYLAIENWSFGFERIVDLRLKPINQASYALSKAEAELGLLKKQRDQKASADSGKREELRRGAERRDASIAELSAQLAREPENHRKNLEEIREACRIIRQECMVPRSKAEDARFRAEAARLNTELTRLREERKTLQAEIDGLVAADASETDELDQEIAGAALVASEKRQALSHAFDGNQIYRLAASWYGVNTSDVTPEQFATARWVFATLGAIAVALAGSVCALVYYAPNRIPGTPSPFAAVLTKASRAYRAYYARKRKALVREVPGPERVIYRDGKEPAVTVEKEVPRFIDRIVLIPRFGIRLPVYVNGLFRRGVQRPSSFAAQGTSEAPSNVQPLQMKVS